MAGSSVGLPVTASVETVPLGASGAGRFGCGGAELGERRFAGEPFGVVARGDEQARGRVVSDALEFEQPGSGLVDERCSVRPTPGRWPMPCGRRSTCRTRTRSASGSGKGSGGTGIDEESGQPAAMNRAIQRATVA